MRSVMHQSALDCNNINDSVSTLDEYSMPVKGLLETLSVIADSLEKTNASLEPRFVKVGEDLQAVFLDSGRLETEATKAAELVGNKSDSSVLRNINDLARKSIDELHIRQDYISQCLQTANLVVKYLQQLHPQSISLIKIAKHLRAISMCFSVESSRSIESVHMFSAFTEKMNSLVFNVFEITDRIRSDSNSAENKQTSAIDFISRGSDKLNVLMQQADAAVKDASNRIDEIVNLSVLALEQIGKQSSDIARQMSSIVVAIQFHDITRQQIEHIVAAIRDEIAVLSELLVSLDYTQENDNAPTMRTYSVLKLQAAQLAQVISSIKKAHQAIKVSFIEIGHASAKLADSTSEVSKDNAQEDPFLDLRMELENLGQLLEHGCELSDHTSEAAQHASEASITLSSHAEQIREINTDISIQAMNAIINSVHLGEKGRVLATLAQEVTQLSGKCSVFVQNIVESLEAIRTLAEKSSNLTRNTDGNFVNSSLELKSGICQITKTYDEFKLSSLSAMQQAISLDKAVNKIESSLEFLSEVENELSIYLKEIRSLLKMIQPEGDQAAIAEINVMDDYAERYTMKSERDIHMQLLDGNESSGKMPLDNETISQLITVLFGDFENDDMGDNVELF